MRRLTESVKDYLVALLHDSFPATAKGVSRPALVRQGWLRQGGLPGLEVFVLTPLGTQVARDVERYRAEREKRAYEGEARSVAEEWGRWKALGPAKAKKCPGCGCSPEFPCLVFMPPAKRGEPVPEDTSQGQCVPAGVFGWKECSACASGQSSRLSNINHLAGRALAGLEATGQARLFPR